MMHRWLIIHAFCGYHDLWRSGTLSDTSQGHARAFPCSKKGICNYIKGCVCPPNNTDVVSCLWSGTFYNAEYILYPDKPHSKDNAMKPGHFWWVKVGRKSHLVAKRQADVSIKSSRGYISWKEHYSTHCFKIYREINFIFLPNRNVLCSPHILALG